MEYEYFAIAPGYTPRLRVVMPKKRVNMEARKRAAKRARRARARRFISDLGEAAAMLALSSLVVLALMGMLVFLT